MNKKEMTQVMTLLAGNYNSIAEKTKEQKQLMFNTWYELLGDLDYKLVLHAIKKSIVSSPYPPTIYDIRKNVIDIINPVVDKRLEAWDECYKMICNGSYMTQDEFDKHNPICKKFLGSIAQLRDYARSNIETVNTVVKSSFLKQYDILLEQEKEQRLLPKEFLQLQEKLTKQIGG